MKKLALALSTVAVFATLPGVALGGVILGDLSREDSSNIVFDSASNLEWLMFDYDFTYTYDELVLSGGVFGEWNVADANQFYQMLGNAGIRPGFPATTLPFPANPSGFLASDDCVDNNPATECQGFLLAGEEFVPDMDVFRSLFWGAGPSGFTGDDFYVMYDPAEGVNDFATDAIAGGLFLRDDTSGLVNFPTINSFLFTDQAIVSTFTSQSMSPGNFAVRHALYRVRETAEVAEPWSVALLASGLILMRTRRSARAAV